jgi:hypothetical protein
MFEFYDEIQENPESDLFNQNGRVLKDELTSDQVNQMWDDLLKKAGFKEPEIDPEAVHKIHTEGINVWNND